MANYVRPDGNQFLKAARQRPDNFCIITIRRLTLSRDHPKIGITGARSGLSIGEVLMDSSMIGKIDKARKYAEEKDRVTITNMKAVFQGNHSIYQVDF